MRNLLALVGAALVTFAAVGWYQGWYQFTTETEPGGHREVKVDINGPKIGKDLDRGAKKLEQVLENKVNNGTPQAPPASAVQLPPGSSAFPPPAGFGTYPAPEPDGYSLPPVPVPVTPTSPRPKLSLDIHVK